MNDTKVPMMGIFPIHVSNLIQKTEKFQERLSLMSLQDNVKDNIFLID